ncbi:polysaccharide deacetylase family protein [Pontibacter silvestris]|uniref:Polysaccharide deacetylase family protein n=1 Tax=Pontibacter silvestris TaxID=2305183 RepID=A0ABW4WUP4_9BACT|nr:polysaccharide deacetylase family protein [Pontibacter silvestris]MCC9136247.1 polysaccharide deacetylase family protein [Pontibacter silvestris]
MRKGFLVLAVVVVVALACLAGVTAFRYWKTDYAYHTPPTASFVISFDDRNITDWYQARDLFRKYNVHATFFLTQPDSLIAKELQMLKELEADGHEIACHGYTHSNSLTYTKEHGIASYIAYEIIPAIREMHARGFAPVTFAYPYGANSRVIDRELLKYFFLLRGDSWKVKGKGIHELDRIFYSFDGDRVINSLGIDAGSGVTLTDIEDGFRRAHKNKEAILIYAQSINNSNEPYSIAPSTLENIFRVAKKYELASLTFKDLVL